MAEVIQKPRRAWVALLLSLVMPGLGHLYAGYTRLGLQFFLLNFATVNLAIFSWAYLIPSFSAFSIFILMVLFVYLFIGLHAFLQVKNQKQAIERFWYTRWYGLAGIYFSWILISAILQPTRTYLQFFHMPASSMAPTLIQGDFLIVQNAAFGVNFPGTHRKILNLRPPNRGDIVVFEYPEDQSKYFIKRVIGLSGETIEIKDKVVYVNGAQLTEPYAIHKDSTVLRAEIGPRDNFGPQSIPENTFFILGDNRDKSLDSRFFGPVGIDGIIGKATLIYFSSDMRSLEIRWDRIGTRFD